MKLRRDEEMVLFPALGWRDPSGQGWFIELHAWVYEMEMRRAPIAALQRLLGLKLKEMTDVEKQFFKERTRWFMVDNEGGKRVQVAMGDQVYDLGRTATNGHVRKLIAVLDGGTERVRALPEGAMALKVPLEDERKVLGTVHLVAEEGWTVVSDVDDTIKVTEVRDRMALVRNTFCRTFKPAEGMAQMYTQWAGQGAVFHYVSASPWQLYPDLETFRAEHGYPQGTFHMRHFRFKDRSGLQFLKNSGEFKPTEIGALLQKFPKRRFVLVGDSGERDPEIYGELARTYPLQVMRILIRDVTGEEPGAERYRTAFQDVAREKWMVFKQPDEVKHLGPPREEKKGR